MLKRTVFFGKPYHISSENKQLKAKCKETEVIKRIPTEDIGFAVFEHAQITFTLGAMQLLAQHNAAVIFCDSQHHPTSMLLNLDAHYIQGERFKEQIQATKTLKKRLWKQTIKAKIFNQARLLELLGKDGTALLHKVDKVKSGDKTNIEAQAARLYWSRLFGQGFLRERYGESPNPALNYGYAILRAAVARALAGSGLLPTLGIHHRNKYNAYCLADDIMEPYRPYVDWVVYDMEQEGLDCENLSTGEKRALLQVLSVDTWIKNRLSPLMIAVVHSAVSLVKCFNGEQKQLMYPIIR